jgi:hypothetical protein
MLRYFLIDYSDKINYEQNKVTEDMIITKPDDFNFSNHSFDIKSLEKFCDDDAYQAIPQYILSTNGNLCTWPYVNQ